VIAPGFSMIGVKESPSAELEEIVSGCSEVAKP
jgi:hypothetical protein